MTTWTVVHQALCPQNFPATEGFPSPGDLPDAGIEPTSSESPALAGGFFTTEPPGKPIILVE